MARRDVILALGEGGATVRALALFILAGVIFAFAVGPDLPLLARLAPAAVWIAAISSLQASFDRLFQGDKDDGGLDALIAAPQPLEILVLAKCLAHWTATGLPLTLAAPLIGVGFGLSGDLVWPLTLSLAIGTPALSLIGAVGASVTASVERGGALITLLTAPLYAPIVIFGVNAAAVPVKDWGSEGNPDLMLLAAVSLFSLVFTPFAAAAALRRDAG